jgi:hypothetical protein
MMRMRVGGGDNHGEGGRSKMVVGKGEGMGGVLVGGLGGWGGG